MDSTTLGSPIPLLPGDLVRLQQRERYIPTDLRQDPTTLASALARVPIWRRPGGSYDHLPSGTLATLLRPVALEDMAARWEIMLQSGEIVFCYAVHIDLVPCNPTPDGV
jgi:hypothetical protein